MTRIVITLLAAACVLAGCNTMRGFGQDVQKAGEKIEQKAKR
jgi:entericidin A